LSAGAELLAVEDVSRRWHVRGREVLALEGVSLGLAPGELVCLRGPSGSGKTTLLLVAGGMLGPSSGRVLLAGQDLYACTARARARLRAMHVGFVFQTFHLVPYLSVRQNVALALGSSTSGERTRAAAEVLERVGLGERSDHRPSELSAGERQRCALARALVGEPSLVLADEPTGNLDAENAAVVLDCLRDFRERGGAVALVTHAAPPADATRSLALDAGRIAAGGELSA